MLYRNKMSKVYIKQDITPTYYYVQLINTFLPYLQAIEFLTTFHKITCYFIHAMVYLPVVYLYKITIDRYPTIYNLLKLNAYNKKLYYLLTFQRNSPKLSFFPQTGLQLQQFVANPIAYAHPAV